MNLRKSLFTLLLAPSLALAADVAYSPPVGGMTVSVPSGQTVTVSLPLLHDRVGTGLMVGRISGVGSNYLDVAGAEWAVAGLSNSANPYYLRIKSGSSSGRIMLVSTTPNTTSRVFLNSDGIDLTAAGGPQVGDSFELILADTLNSFFGSSTLVGGVDAASSDNVQIWSGVAWQIYYYNTTRSRWERSGFASINANNIVLRPDRGIMITRRSGTELKMYVNGRVPELAPRYFHSRAGNTFVSSGVPVAQTLIQFGLQTRAAGWTSGSSINDADSLQVWSGVAWQSYFYSSANSRWQREGFPNTNANNVNLAGRPIMIRRLNAALPVDSLVAFPMPYAVN